MVIKIVRRRLVVGLRKGEWDEVYLEPILETDDLTTPNHAPEIGLYSRSHGEATENEPMFGEVAWEPLLNHEYFGSSAKPERLMLQKMIDASQASVNGVVRLKLYKGNVIVVGRKSDESLFDANIATFEEDGGAYNQADAAGFIKLNALRMRIAAGKGRTLL